jgi:hypothetical protein
VKRTSLFKGVYALAVVFLVYVAGLLTAVYNGPPYVQTKNLLTYIKALDDNKTFYDTMDQLRYKLARNTVKGVAVNNPKKTYKGLTLYGSSESMSANLINMSGKLLHQWQFSLADINETTSPNPLFFRRVKLLPDGDLIGLFKPMGAATQPSGVLRASRDGNIKWLFKGAPAHHDFEVLADGRMLVLTQTIQTKHLTEALLKRPYINEQLTVLDHHGREIKTISITEAFLNSPYKNTMLTSIQPDNGDLIHLNALHFITEDEAKKMAFAKAGQVLLSVLNLSTMAILDMETEKIVTVFPAQFDGIHSPSLFKSNQILLFENYGGRYTNQGKQGKLKGSALTVYNPQTNTRSVLYAGLKNYPLMSRTRGELELLPNGNVLVFESDAGCIIEVTQSGELVWQYYNPLRVQDMISVISGGGRYPYSYWLTSSTLKDNA